MAYMGALTLRCSARIAEENSLVLVKVRSNFDIQEPTLSLSLNDGESHDLFFWRVLRLNRQSLPRRSVIRSSSGEIKVIPHGW